MDAVERVARAIVASFTEGSPDIAAAMRMDWQTWAPEARAAIAAYEARQSDDATECKHCGATRYERLSIVDGVCDDCERDLPE